MLYVQNPKLDQIFQRYFWDLRSDKLNEIAFFKSGTEYIYLFVPEVAIICHS